MTNLHMLDARLWHGTHVEQHFNPTIFHEGRDVCGFEDGHPDAATKRLLETRRHDAVFLGLLYHLKHKVSSLGGLSK